MVLWACLSYKHNTCLQSDPLSDLNNTQMFPSPATTTVMHSSERAHDSGTPSVTHSEDSCFVSAASAILADRVRFQLVLRSMGLDSLYCPQKARRNKAGIFLHREGGNSLVLSVQ